jgi:putative ABC transport system permease protein
MRLKKILQLAWNLLVHSKLRSWLTIIGIVIGIAAVVSIVSISEGAQQSLEERFGELGADQVTITPGFSRAMRFPGRVPGGARLVESNDDDEPLTEKDILVIGNVASVKNVMGQVSGTVEMKYLGEGGDVQVTGVDASKWALITTDEVEHGRYLGKSDTYSVILGYQRANEYFEKSVQINRQITIGGKLFKVVGILGEGENDRAVIVPIKVARDLIEDVEFDEVHSITVQVEDVELVDEAVEVIEKKLMLARGILSQYDKDFTISSVKELQETISETLNTMALFLGAIAAVSLLVGGVGISNTMFTSVLEKTKEIGIMKAIGAKNRDIMSIFLINSGMIGFVGGLGGVVVGSIASGIIGTLISSGTSGGGPGRMMMSTALTPELLIFAFSFSIVVGMVAGVIPAYRASKLKPVDALRYE